MSDPLERGQLRAIVEAVLMTADSPVTPGRLQALVKGARGGQLRQAVQDLNESYREGGHAMTIAEVAGGYQVVTLKEFAPWLRKFHDRSHVRLSQAALETLAIIAFKQPVTRIEIDGLRGVDSAGVVRNLLELNLVRIVGRSEAIGRAMLFGTTRDFMTHFGLRSLGDLPRPKELEELLAEGERKAHADAGNGRVQAAAPAGEEDPREEDPREEELPEVGGVVEGEGGVETDEGSEGDGRS